MLRTSQTERRRARGEILVGERARGDTSLCPAVAKRNLLPDSKGGTSLLVVRATTEKVLNSVGNAGSQRAFQVKFPQECLRWL